MARKKQEDSKSVMLAPNGLISFDDERIPYPDVLGSYKFDGNRCFVRYDGAILTRHMLKQPNGNLSRFLAPLVAAAVRHGVCFDMELLIPDATHHGVHGKVFNSHTAPIPENTQVQVFDCLMAEAWDGDVPFKPFRERIAQLTRVFDREILPSRFVQVEQRLLKSADEAQRMFAEAIEAGHEGIMLRRADGGYKNYSRCTHREAMLLKFKAEETHDGWITKVEQQWKMKEGLTRTRNKQGLMETPTRNEDNYELTDAVGSFLVETEDGVTSRIMFAEGVADQAKRRAWWKKRSTLIGKCVEFKCYPGGKDGIRSGRMLRWRPDKD